MDPYNFGTVWYYALWMPDGHSTIITIYEGFRKKFGPWDYDSYTKRIISGPYTDFDAAMKAATDVIPYRAHHLYG